MTKMAICPISMEVVNYKTLGLPEDLARKVTEPVCIIDGEPKAECGVLIQKAGTNYRGDILIGIIGDKGATGRKGQCVGLVELYDVRPCRGLTQNDWHYAVIPAGVSRIEGFAWFVRNPRRVVELDVPVQKSLRTIGVPGGVTEYPVHLEIDADGWKEIQRKIRK